MALIKKITLENGISTNYHRVVSINNIINCETVLEVASYTTKSKREEEKQAIKNGDKMDIYIHTEFIPLEYDKNLNVDSAYEYLKLSEVFENAKDDID